jgi:hypothetical protein
VARPKKDIDEKLVKKLASFGCTVEEIAAITDAGKRTIDRRFGTVIKKAFKGFKGSIRRQQWKLAMQGNAAMCIWLGKIVLGQRETQRIENTGADGGPIETRTALVVKDADDWYGRTDDLAPKGVASSNGHTDEPIPIQGGGMRPSVGQNGAGANGSA